MSQVLETEYKGNPMLVIRNGEQDKFPFQFGLRKAQMILANLEAIQAFAEKHTK